MATIISSEIARDIELLRKGSFGDRNDVQHHVLSDSVQFQAGIPADGYIFFGRGQGSALTSTITKQKYETNLPSNGQLPAGQTFLAKKMQLALISNRPSADTDIVDYTNAFYQLIKNSYLQFRIEGKSEFEFETHGSVFFPAVCEVGDTANTLGALRVGDFNHHSWTTLLTPIVLGELVTFKVILKPGSSDTATIGPRLTVLNDALASQYAQIRCSLNGTLVRSK